MNRAQCSIFQQLLHLFIKTGAFAPAKTSALLRPCGLILKFQSRICLFDRCQFAVLRFGRAVCRVTHDTLLDVFLHILCGDRISAENDEPLQHVAQFAYVARPVVVFERFQCLGVDFAGSNAVF